MKKRKKSRRIADKFLSILLIVTVLTSMILSLARVVLAAEDAEVIEIHTAEEYEELAKQCTLDTWSQGKKVVLQADIDLSEAKVVTIPTFGGEFDGNGYSISGLNITDGATPSGLFSVLQENAVVKNLNVSGSVEPSGKGSYVGGIVGENYGTVTGCSYTGNVSGESNVGGIVGINAVTGQISTCRSSGSVVGDRMTGGIAGCNLGVVEECQNSAYVNTVSVDPALSPDDINFDFSLDVSKLSSVDTNMSSSDTGGIAGYSSGIVSQCSNHAPVGYPHIGYNVGGIIGRSCGYIDTCENHAEIFGRKDTGGIAGQMEPYIAQNISESTLAKLENQLGELDAMLTTALNDANAGVGAVTSRLNRIADYMDSAAGAASNIRTSGSVNSSATGSGEAGGSGSATVTLPQAEAEGSSEASGGAGAIVTPGGGVTGGGVSVEGEVQAGLTDGSVEGNNQSSAGGSVSASTQISVTTNLGGLSSAISGMSGQMRLLNGEISGTSGTMTADLKAIQEQINAISETAMEMFRGGGEGDILIDSSEANIDTITLGKALNCSNNGSVSGDINVGGIAGSMAMEYELDPEDDVTSEMDGEQRRKLEVRSVIQDCVSNGTVTAKRNYAGGICGRMDLGLITRSEGYGSITSENGDYAGGIAGLTASSVRNCYAKCTLSGQKNVGGIVGSGVTEDLSGGSSTVAGCYSMVSIASCQEFAGAISGVNAGNFVENYFVSDTLTGINGKSYSGKAEPISYEALLKQAGGESEEAGAGSVPDAFMQLTLTFVADGETVKTMPVEYGESFDDSVFPEIPEKEGYYACWNQTELTEIRFDTVVNAVYTPYVTALSDSQTRSGGRPIFFVEGEFNDEAAVDVKACPNTPSDFDFLVTDWSDYLTKSFPGMKASREIVEQWRISIADNGGKKHTVRYLPPDEDPENLDIYVKGQDGWKKADTEVIGSYLTFSVDGPETEIAVISTMNLWWVWIIVCILVLFLLLLLIRMIRRMVRSGKKKPTGTDHSGQEEDFRKMEGFDPAESRLNGVVIPRKKKKRWVVPVLIILALLAGVVGTAAFFLLPDLKDGMKACELLKKYAQREELAMELTVDAEVDLEHTGFTAVLSRTDLDGHQVTAISQDERTLYYCEGAIFLENGTAYKLSDAFPDYSKLLDHATELYQNVEIEEKNGTYTITAEGEEAKAILELLMPSETRIPAETNEIQIELETEEEEVSELRFSGNGMLQDSEKTPFHISAVLEIETEQENRIPIPEAVRSSIADGDYEAEEAVSDDLIRLMNAWKTLNEEEEMGAELILKANCGPITLDDQFAFYRWHSEGVQISSIQKNGFSMYFTDEVICNQNGEIMLETDAKNIEAAKLLDIAYQACMNSHMDCSSENQIYTYTLSLDEKGMETIAYAIAPEAEEMDISFSSGSIQVVVSEDRLQSIAIYCSGTVQIVLSDTEVTFEAQMEFPQDAEKTDIPEAVKSALK